MSLFDFPRIHFKGTISLNPGTANNDDFAPSAKMTSKWGPFAGEPFGLIDSKTVRARTFGMSDEQFIAWVQKPQEFDSKRTPLMPAEWNYYGDMGSNATARVIGVQTGPDKVYTSADAAVPLTSLLSETVAFQGSITDVNSEGSPPATQFFIESLTLGNAVKGRPSKGAAQWLNFFRNVNLTADAGAGAYVYHVLRKGDGTTIDIPGYDAKNVCGLILRYYLYRTIQGVTDLPGLAAIYAERKTNPAQLEVAGTIAPLLNDETIFTGPVGRLLIQNTASIGTPPGTRNNGGGAVALAPAVLQQRGNTISADFIGTFPDYYSQKSGQNPKFDFGPVTLSVTGGGATVDIAPVRYADTADGDSRGWIYDFDVSSNGAAQKALQDPDATFLLLSRFYGGVLAETTYYFVSNQQGIYAEQCGAGDRFLNQGTEEPATVSVYRRGKLLAREECPPMTLWQYRSIPLQSPGDAIALSTSFKPGDPIVVDTSHPGNFLFTFTINDGSNPAPAGYPPKSYLDFQNPPWITNAPSISLRILPNDEDFSRYYVDPAADEPVGNELLTFEVVYEKVLRVYYLLYPAMNKIFALNHEPSVRRFAKVILQVTEMSQWMTTRYMPRTRDLSASRRKLLRAWCRKVSPGS